MLVISTNLLLMRERLPRLAQDYISHPDRLGPLTSGNELLGHALLKSGHEVGVRDYEPKTREVYEE